MSHHSYFLVKFHPCIWSFSLWKLLCDFYYRQHCKFARLYSKLPWLYFKTIYYNTAWLCAFICYHGIQLYTTCKDGPPKMVATLIKVHKWYAWNVIIWHPLWAISVIILAWATGLLTLLESITEVLNWQATKMGNTSTFWFSSCFFLMIMVKIS